VRAARMHAIKADIAQNLDVDVSVDALAARHRISPRYIRKLFEGDDTSFSMGARPAPGPCPSDAHRSPLGSFHHKRHCLRGRVRRPLNVQSAVSPAFRRDTVGCASHTSGCHFHREEESWAAQQLSAGVDQRLPSSGQRERSAPARRLPRLRGSGVEKPEHLGRRLSRVRRALAAARS
jgi:hypothetical protein